MLKNKLFFSERSLRILILSAIIIYSLAYIILALLRMNYPFELEWMEGGSVEHVYRLMHGQEIFVKPSLDFIPYIYTPLYFWVSFGVAKLAGLGFFPLRLVSFVFSLVCMLFIYLIVKKETGSKFFGLVSMGMFPACFIIGGAWYDLARVDSMFIAFLLIAVYILRFHQSGKYYILAGIAAFLSFFTKQSVLMLFGIMGLYLLFENWKRSLYFILTFAVLAISSTLIYNHYTDGWYFFWNFILPADHRWNKQFLLLFWTSDMFKPLSISIAFSILYFIIKKRAGEAKSTHFYLAWLIGMIWLAWFSRLHYGGYDNVLIPAHIIFSVLLGLGGYELLKKFGNDGSANKSNIAQILVLLLLLAQFTTLYFNPRRQMPHDYDYREGWNYMSHLKNVKGEVYITTNTYISRIAGKKPFTHIMLVFDLMQSSSKYGDSIRVEFDKALAEGKFTELHVNDWVLLNYPKINEYYRYERRIFPGAGDFYALTGFITRPEYIYVKKK